MLRGYPAIFMYLSPLFMEMWSFETIHCLTFNVQLWKRHDVLTHRRKIENLFVLLCKTILFLLNQTFLFLNSIFA